MHRPIFIFRDSRQEGPYTADQLRAMLDSGAVVPSTLAFSEGMSGWAPLHTVVPPAPKPPLILTPPPVPIFQTEDSLSAAPSLACGAGGPKGVGGWLVFFCVALTILGPLYAVGQMLSSWVASEDAFSRFPSLRTAVIWENFGWTLILVYGLVVGVIIWNGSPSGRSIARKYLLIRLVAFAAVEFTAILLLVDNVPPGMLARAIEIIFGSAMREVIFFLIWWFYFEKSQRVRNTYVSIE